MGNHKIPTTVKNKELVEKRREQIVLAAIKLFSRKGFHKTNLKELAEEAGLSHGNIYDYVGSKQDIFFLIHEFINNLATQRIEKAIGKFDDPLELVRRMVRAEFDFMHEWSDAVLLIYQETHVLKKRLLKELLKRERERVSILERSLEACKNKGVLRDVNIRVASNLVKGMTETWVSKRWDLRGHASRKEMEDTIIDVIFNGLLKKKQFVPQEVGRSDELQGKSAVVLNAGTLLGKAISYFLFSKGVKLFMHSENALEEEREYPIPGTEIWKKAKIYRSDVDGPLTVQLFKQILNDGPIDFVIHDLGISTKERVTHKNLREASGSRLQQNLDCAKCLATWIKEQRSQTSIKRILYLAPWAWDRYADPIAYAITKGGVLALTKEIARILAEVSINVNCIVPGFIAGVRPLKIEQEISSQVSGYIPMASLGEVSDVVETVRFLVSPDSKYLTGQTLNVSGGM